VNSKDSDSEAYSKNEDVGHTTAEVVIQKQVEKEKARPRTDKEIEAEKVGDAQVKRYWKERENERITKRGMFWHLDLGGISLIGKDCELTFEYSSSSKRYLYT